MSKSVKKAIDASIRDDLDTIVSKSRSELSKPAHRYLESLVDPKNHRSKVPTLLGGNPGRTGQIVCKSKVTVGVGTGGYGYIVMNPSCIPTSDWTGGPFTDRLCAVFTTGLLYAGTGASTLPSTPGTGVSVTEWANAQVSSAGSIYSTDYQWRCVSAAIYVNPTSAALDQGGMIYMIESEGHGKLSENLSTITGLQRTRGVRGAQMGNNEPIVLNWHPVAVSSAAQGSSNFLNPFEFRTVGGANSTQTPQGGLCCIFTGASGLTFECELIANYEVRGTKVFTKTVSLVDSRGMDMVMNAIMSRTTSGWIGKPHHAYVGYMTRLYDTAKHIFYKNTRIGKKVKDVGAVRALASEVMGSVLL